MKTLLILHGAIGAADQFNAIKNKLESDYNVHTLNFSGHGGKGYSIEPFSIKLFATEVAEYIAEYGLSEVYIFGYSMGGYVAMYLAKHHPELVSKIITLATKFDWDEATAAKEMKMLRAEVIEEKVPKFAKILSERHAPNDWKEVLQHTADMLHSMGANNPLKLKDYSKINTPSLILVGDRDKMITLEETVAVYKALPEAQMGVLPNTHHPIEQVNEEYLLFAIHQFLG